MYTALLRYYGEHQYAIRDQILMLITIRLVRGCDAEDMLTIRVSGASLMSKWQLLCVSRFRYMR